MFAKRINDTYLTRINPSEWKTRKKITENTRGGWDGGEVNGSGDILCYDEFKPRDCTVHAVSNFVFFLADRSA